MWWSDEAVKRARGSPRRARRRHPGDRHGFTLVEILIAMSVLTVALLGIGSMFPAGYMNVTEGGKTTMALTAARQVLEDMGTIPFDDIDNLDDFDTQNPVTLPADGPERTIARRWRYALAGEGDGFTFNTAEKASWTTVSRASATFGGRGQISVVDERPTLWRVTITVSIPGRSRSVEMTTLISRL